ncbi:MAG: VOC family protein [Coriobacteriia bacterium]|nr:VOC family protein [Coriobacteriia bacterium]
MKCQFVHFCVHVLDRDASIKFYEEALGMKVSSVLEPEDKSWSNTYMKREDDDFEIELTWNKGRTEPYENGGKDLHLALMVEDYDAALEHHKKMGVVEKVNEAMGIYFINDPDGVRIEIVPSRH